MANKEEPTLKMIYDLLTKMKESYESLKKDQNEMKDTLNSLITEKEELQKENKDLREELKNLRQQVEEIEVTQDDLNQYQRKHNLEFHGIPEEDDEDINNIVEDIAKQIGVEDFDSDDIDIAHRLPSKKMPRPIIVKFRNYEDKKNLYQARFKLRGWSNPDGYTLNGATKIYINESLTPKRRQQFNEVRKRAKQNGWYSVSTMDGKIFIKREKGHRSARIKNTADLEMFYF